LAGALLVIIGILLPSRDSSPATKWPRSQIDLQSQSQPQSSQQAMPLPPITTTPTVNDADQMAPVAPEPIQDEPADQGRARPLSALNPHSNIRTGH
jgi:hypothetical protein